ncbi:unnamed protein product [Diabrotica balteata]|uniref:Uncharacterized protein n=1 Tax=Diabrotica balteata TaxID=107213 RepID=A0A9N9T3F3_DIABA|nr:unnamed protein product [Diabrotica balteata]
MDIPSTSGKSNNTFDDSDVSSIDDPYADSGSSYNPSDIEESSSEKKYRYLIIIIIVCEKLINFVLGENEKVLVTDENLQSNFQSNDIANPGEILRRKKRGPRRKFANKKRETIFKDFYELTNYDLQTSYLCGQIKLTSKLANTAKSDSRKYTRQYYLTRETGLDIPVCKEFFKKVLRVLDGRLTRALRNKEQGSTPSKDKRGKKEPHNKTSQEKLDNIFHFISRFPKYQSHYSRTKNPNLCYLAPTLNLSTMYFLYKQETNAPASQFVFRDVFRKKFNLTFHAPISDSCRCDEFEQKIKTETSEVSLASLQLEKELHLRKAESARAGMALDLELGKMAENDVTVIAFDLMSTLPTPHLSTGICYYKRQLWTYCLGIHNLSSNLAHMYVWHEAIASRGPQEIGSCIQHYVKNYVNTSKLIMYSDQCGGQNRNILFGNYIIQNKISKVQQIDHKFLVSGHPYLACDRYFGIIEKNKKTFNDIYVASDWTRVIRTAKKQKPFTVVEMTSNDFVSSVPLEKTITNRKKTVEGESVNWLKMQWLRYSLTEPLQLQYKESNNPNVIFKHIDITKRNISMFIGKLPLLYPKGRDIEAAKFSNLQDLLVPKVDTCSTCDSLAVQIKSGDKAAATEQELHHRRAEAATKAMSTETKNAYTSNCYVLSFDMQQQMYIPQLTHSEMYYSQ